MFVSYGLESLNSIFMLCSLVHLVSRILDYSEDTTSQRGSLCMWSKLEIINIVVF